LKKYFTTRRKYGNKNYLGMAKALFLGPIDFGQRLLKPNSSIVGCREERAELLHQRSFDSLQNFFLESFDDPLMQN
jgi:hypothetical protein